MGLCTCLSDRSLPFSVEGTPTPLHLHISSYLSMNECHGGHGDAWTRSFFKEGPVVSARGNAGLGQSSAFCLFRGYLCCWECLTHVHVLPTWALSSGRLWQGFKGLAISTQPERLSLGCHQSLTSPSLQTCFLRIPFTDVDDP